MTAWRTPPVLQADTQSNNGKDHPRLRGDRLTGSQPMSAAAIREQPDAVESSARPNSFASTIKQLFREVKRTLTCKAPAPQPKRRKRGEDTGRAAFRMAARKIMRRAVCIPAEAYATATAYLTDTLDWLNQWHQHDDDLNEDFQAAPTDQLSPHL